MGSLAGEGYSGGLACTHCKKEKGNDTRLSECSRCCGPSYCAYLNQSFHGSLPDGLSRRACQEAAWKGGHKGECYSMAMEKCIKIAAQKGGQEELLDYVGSLMEAATVGEDLPAADRHLVKIIKLLSRTLAAREVSGDLRQLYHMSIVTVGALAAKEQGGDEEPMGSDAWREAAFRELRDAIDKYRNVICENSPPMLFLITVTSIKILNRLGRFQEAVALGREELPAMEALPWEGPTAGILTEYYRQLGEWMVESYGHARSPELRNRPVLDGTRRCLELSMEAERLFIKGLARAETGRPYDQNMVFQLRARLVNLLLGRCAYIEAYPYTRRAFETATPQNFFDAASTHASVARGLARYTEAEEVLRYGLSKLGTTHDTKDKTAADLRLELSELLCKKGCADEALMHATYVREVYRDINEVTGSDLELVQLGRLWQLSANILEKMGRLEEAILHDECAHRVLRGIRDPLRARRQLKKLVKDEDFEKAHLMAVVQLGHLVDGRDWDFILYVPHAEENAALEAIAEMFEEHELHPLDRVYAASIRADVAETRAITQALQDALLVETREEALAARRRRDAENQWLDVGAGSRGGRKGKQQGKKGKRRPKKADKAKGKNKSGTRASTDKETGPDTARGREQQQQEEEEEHGGGTKAGAAEDSEHGPAEAAEGGCAEEEGLEECAVCLLEFDEDEDEAGVLLVCGHRFHGPCVDLWVSNCSFKGLQATCPMCRTDIKY